VGTDVVVTGGGGSTGIPGFVGIGWAKAIFLDESTTKNVVMRKVRCAAVFINVRAVMRGVEEATRKTVREMGWGFCRGSVVQAET
jgi:hypothetical protein